MGHYRYGTIAALFFISGGTSLAYQAIWFRRFANAWGSSTMAMAAVVSSFLIGLALGAYLFGRLAPKIARPFQGYGLLEMAIGVWGLLVPTLLSWVTSRDYTHTPTDPVLLFAIRSATALLVIGLPCLCMGGTLPLLVEFHARRNMSVGGSTAWLYGINTLGGACGCYLAGFHFLPLYGNLHTNVAVALANIAVGAVAFMTPIGAPGPHSANIKVADAGPLPRRRPSLVLMASALTGCAALILEMIWARQLALIVGGSTYTFTATLTLVLLGIGIGGLLYHRIEQFSFMPCKLLQLNMLVIAAICAFVALSQFAIPQLCFLAGSARELRESHVWNGLVCSAIAAALELVPAIGMGVLFPALAQVLERGPQGRSQVVGSLYLLNTAGSALGAVVACSLLVPHIGVAGAVSACIVLYLVSAILLVIDAGSMSLSWTMLTTVCGAGLLFVVSATRDPLPANLGCYLYGSERFVNNYPKTLFFKEGPSCNVLVSESTSGVRLLRVNGKVDASTGGDQKSQLGCAYLARFVQPDARNVCVIGLGSGATVGASLVFPDTHVTCYELEPAVYEGVGYFAEINHRPWPADRFRIEFDDARSAMRRTGERFDLIISQPSNPWIAGVSSLYTVDFYEAVKQRLSEEGVFAQWVQTYNFTRKEFDLVACTLCHAFTQVGIVRISDTDTLIVAANKPLAPTLDDVETAQRLVDSSAAAQADLTTYFGTTDVRTLLLSHFILDHAGVQRLEAGDDKRGLVNTDVNMRLEFDAPRQLYRRHIPVNERVDIALKRAMHASWYEQCVDTWGCQAEHNLPLEKILQDMISHGDHSQVARMIAICRRNDPTDWHFESMQRAWLAAESTEAVH